MKLHFRNSKFASGDGKELWMNQEPASLHDGQETHPTSSTQQEIPPEGDDINHEGNAVNAEQNNTHGSDEAITYGKLEEHFGKKPEDVAQIFGVSRSTFKRICRQNGIDRWPQGRRRRPDPPRSDLPTVTPPPPPPEVRTMTIKATCGDDMIKFKLPLSSRMVDLEEKVNMRLELAVGTYKIKYTDDGGDQVLIACDDDLQNCMRASNSLGMNTVKMFIEPVA